MRLIDADALIETVDSLPKDYGRLEDSEVLYAIVTAPTVDAVEVVRCCDCKYSAVPYKDSEGNVACLYCQHPKQDEDALSPIVDFTDFCSYGERRESEGK